MVKINIHCYAEAYGWISVDENDIPDNWNDMTEEEQIEWIDTYALYNFKPFDVEHVESIDVVHHVISDK